MRGQTAPGQGQAGPSWQSFMDDVRDVRQYVARRQKDRPVLGEMPSPTLDLAPLVPLVRTFSTNTDSKSGGQGNRGRMEMFRTSFSDHESGWSRESDHLSRRQVDQIIKNFGHLDETKDLGRSEGFLTGQTLSAGRLSPLAP